MPITPKGPLITFIIYMYIFGIYTHFMRIRRFRRFHYNLCITIQVILNFAEFAYFAGFANSSVSLSGDSPYEGTPTICQIYRWGLFKWQARFTSIQHMQCITGRLSTWSLRSNLWLLSGLPGFASLMLYDPFTFYDLHSWRGRNTQVTYVTCM